MRLLPKNIARKFQEGGPMEGPEMAPEQAPEVAPMPEQEGSQDPLMQIAQMAMQALQTNDGQLALQVCDALLQLLQQAQGGAPQAPQGEPVYRRGGKLAYRI